MAVVYADLLQRPSWRMTRRSLLALLGLAILAAAAWGGYQVSHMRGVAELRAESNHRLDLFSSAVRGVIERLEYVPATVQLNQDVIDLLNHPDDPAQWRVGNDYLTRLNAHLGSTAVFIMNDRGAVIASSNGDVPDDSLLHQDLSFRPYFLEALSGRVGRHFAIGIDGGEPGYFVSHPIRDGARVIGVAAIKISLEPIERIWNMLGAPALLADANQVVILSSDPDWRYTALEDLALERRVDLQISRLYNNRRIGRFPEPLPHPKELGQGAERGGTLEVLAPTPHRSAGSLVLVRMLDGMDWRVMAFSDLDAVRSRALVGSASAAIAASFVLLLVLFLLQKRRIQRQKAGARLMLERVNAELERNVASRTRDLTDANLRLRKEVADRERAERTLRDAQGELVQTAKMAILGQLATGITHELTQPLGAIRTLSGNASEFLRRGDLDALSGNLTIIARMADQMGGIIQPLKGFARKSLPVPARVDVAHAVGNALFLYESRLRKEGVELINHCVPGRVHAWCDANRLEQVLINLVGNAIDAMDAVACRRLTLDARINGLVARIEVLDSGTGLTEATRTRLFEPFFTTKPSGVGLGLGLAISRDIVREFGGDIEATHQPQGGALFCILLPTGPDGHAS